MIMGEGAVQLGVETKDIGGACKHALSWVTNELWGNVFGLTFLQEVGLLLNVERRNL